VVITPGVRYRRFTPTVSIGEAEIETDDSYVTIEMGFSLKF